MGAIQLSRATPAAEPGISGIETDPVFGPYTNGIRHSVEVTAETLYEAAVLGMTTLRAAAWMEAPNLTIEVTVKAPETTHSISSGVLAAWLSRSGKSPREQALKSRLLELMRSGSAKGQTMESGAETLRRR